MRSKTAYKTIYDDLLIAYAKDPNMTNKVEMSDYGINVFREEARKLGYGRPEMEAIFKEELGRVRGLTADPAGLVKYLRTSRVGSKFRLNRKARAGLFLQLAAKGFLRPGRVASATSALREGLVRLAEEKPELRKLLVPILRGEAE
jgi:hypothetical protein